MDNNLKGVLAFVYYGSIVNRAATSENKSSDMFLVCRKAKWRSQSTGPYAGKWGVGGENTPFGGKLLQNHAVFYPKVTLHP